MLNINADLAQLHAQTLIQTDHASVPHAADIAHYIPVFEGSMVRDIALREEPYSVVEACVVGYAFPASLDLAPPVGGLAPASGQAMMLKARRDGVWAADFAVKVERHQALKRSC